MVRVSVIIPIYNMENTLKSTLISLQNQIFDDFEIIIIDDCSTDKSREIAKRNSLSNCKIYKNKKNEGPAKSRNKGIKLAKGEIIAFIDADCVASKSWLNSIVDNFSKLRIDVLMGNTKIPKSTFLGDSISELGFPGGANAGFKNIWHVDEYGYTNHITSCNFATTKEIFEKYGDFDESFPLPGGEDSELSQRLYGQGVKIMYCENVLVYHEPRKNLVSFIKWNILRGRSNFHFKRKVNKVGGFIKLRLWSSKNIIVKNLFNAKIFLIFLLLGLSFLLQQYGYFMESKKGGSHDT